MPLPFDCAPTVPEAVGPEAAGPEAERWAQLALDLARMGTWSLDLSTDEMEADARERELIGFAPGEAVTGEAFFARVHPDDVGPLRAAIAASVAAHGTYDAEFRVRLPDGGVRQIVVRGRVECDPSGSPVRVAGVNYDVTAVREAERALHAVETT
ncbi:MAG TPA: PAS domain-containing protein, partial [Rubricoccaceae bacterium]